MMPMSPQQPTVPGLPPQGLPGQGSQPGAPSGEPLFDVMDLSDDDRPGPEEVNYMWGRSCATCNHYMAPEGCAEVNGHIRPDGVCDLHNQRPGLPEDATNGDV